MNNYLEVDIEILIGQSDSSISENEIEMVKLLRKKREKINKVKQLIKKKSSFDKKISIVSENNKNNLNLSPKKSYKEKNYNNFPEIFSPKKSNKEKRNNNFSQILSPKKFNKDENNNNFSPILSPKKSNSSFVSLSKKLNNDESNNFIPILSHKDSFIKDFEEKKDKNLEIKTYFNIPKFYFQEPIKSSILISDFPGFDLIKKQSYKIINENIKEIGNSLNNEFVNITYLKDKKFEEIKKKLSNNELDYYPKGEKDLLKYCPIDIPGLNYPKLINIKCNPKEGIYLTNLYNILKEKKNQSQFRKFILNISKDVIIYNYIIDNSNANKIESINIENINIDYFKSLNIEFYNFIQNPGETLIVEPGSIHISYIKNESNDIMNCQIIYWSNAIFDNNKDLCHAINFNSDYLFFPLINTLLRMLNINLYKLSSSSIENVYYFLQKLFLEENLIIRELKQNKKICKYYHCNILNCSDCFREIMNYYTFINRNKVICPKCFSNYTFEYIFQKYKEEDINLLFERLKKGFSNNYSQNSDFIKKSQKCFEMNCPNDTFNLIKNEVFFDEEIKNKNMLIDRFLIPLIDIDNNTREGLFNPLSIKYINIIDEAYTKFKYKSEKNFDLIRNNSTKENLSYLLFSDNKKKEMKNINNNNNDDNDNVKKEKSNEIKNKIKGISIFDLFG